ncbi:hypothetical protein NU195Hw_g6464t1 [Hortaea werneckii]
MRVFDHDLGEVFLGGIDTSYVPAVCQDPTSCDDKVQGQLRAIAICLHKHQNLMPWAEPGAPRDKNDPASKYNLARKSNLAHLVCGL